ncbi:hypothetical protein DPMN_149792 [Dreissena polymorpha]|uniref:Uncharacterized protein n=1 Tax=Dreissena polymorpha TaxID=45954 RepID=A0A9D4FC06_DREPO|nr:hypothetical protein DPMN_149792 [Dreissena polymorpha]
MLLHREGVPTQGVSSFTGKGSPHGEFVTSLGKGPQTGSKYENVTGNASPHME